MRYFESKIKFLKEAKQAIQKFSVNKGSNGEINQFTTAGLSWLRKP